MEDSIINTLPALHQKIEQKHIKGFLAQDEAEALYDLARSQAGLGACLEVGSYCGLSTVYLGQGVMASDGILYAVDHHRGSEEHQVGEAYHDTDLYDASALRVDSFPTFQRTLDMFDLNSYVVPIVSCSATVARHWQQPLSLVFIDGGHSEAMSLEDCMLWGKWIAPGGVLAIHDIFPNPQDGGQGPYKALLAAQAAYGLIWEKTQNSLGILRKP